MEQKAGPDEVVQVRQPKPTMVTFMVDDWYAPTENEGERPPKMRRIRALPDELIEDESEEEPA